jgi:8-oxo-dGTP pyrophosphatase MutT (NUDIX family)
MTPGAVSAPSAAPLPTCLAAAVAHDGAARIPFVVDGREVGSVARAHLVALRRWPAALDIGADAVTLRAPAATRDAALAAIHQQLRAEGLLLGWRNETFALFDPATLAPLARIERAAARFWGTLTLGAHATGYVAGADGRPAALWIARRADDKATDPGLFDNLIGGGVPVGQSALDALLREAFEEAGLSREQANAARPAGVLRLHRDVREGRQQEWIHSFDLELPAGLQPQNQDGEVAGFTLLPVADALQLAGAAAMTVDAALVTIDFLHRHRFIARREVGDALQALRVVLPG